MKDNNSGSYNSGSDNSGSYNSGSCNSCSYNSGSYNSGSCNSGDYNSGSYNSGDYNSGYYNSGSYNSGSCNSGSCNSGDYNSGYCNNITPTIRLFNKDSGINFNTVEGDKIYSTIKKYQNSFCEWIASSNMSSEEKRNNPKYEITNGYLKVNKNYFYDVNVSQDDEVYFRSLPNFDEAIFKECTGIDLLRKTVKITIDGKDIQISKEEFDNINKQFCDI